MNAIQRNNVTDHGGDGPPLLFVHGFGCDQTMWSLTEPSFRDDYRTLLYDLTGMGSSDTDAYDAGRHATLHGHAADLIDVCEATGLTDATVVGHSVGATIALLAALSRPDLIARLVLITPSPCFLNDGDYQGGFTQAELEELIDLMDSNYVAWADHLSGVLNGPENPKEVALDLHTRFCALDHRIARHFARVTFMSDHRDDVRALEVPALVVSVADDAVVPNGVGPWMAAAARNARMMRLSATGHCPHVTAPEETRSVIEAYLAA